MENISDQINQPVKNFQKEYYRLKDLKNEADLNKDGNLSNYEILIAVFTVPKYIAALFGFIASIYAIIQSVVNWTNDANTNPVLLTAAICFVVAMVVVYLMLNKINGAEETTFKNLNGTWEKKLNIANETIQTQKETIEKKDDEIQAWKTKATLFAFQAQSYRKRHPDDEFPDITEVEKHAST